MESRDATSLQEEFAALGVKVPPETIDKLGVHARLLLHWNSATHLVSEGDARGRALSRHYVEAARALPFLDGSRRLLDLGSGAGFPGLVWATLLPEKESILVEQDSRKAAFLREVRLALALPRVEIVEERIDTPERLAELDADVLTTRATRAGDLLFQAGWLRASVGKQILLYVSRRVADERLRQHIQGYELESEMALGTAWFGFLLAYRKLPS